jgi:hypothetical protein
MIRRLLSAAVLSALVACPAAVKADEWKVFKAPDGEFEIKLPTDPAVQKQEQPTPAGNMKMTMYVSSDNDTATVYMVASCEFPPALKPMLKENPKAIYDGVFAGMIQASMGKETASREVKMGQYTGREMEATVFNGNGRMIGRAFVINDKVYMLLIMSPKDKDLKEDSKKLFDSFKVK